jgi:hypothetical protein
VIVQESESGIRYHNHGVSGIFSTNPAKNHATSRLLPKLKKRSLRLDHQPLATARPANWCVSDSRPTHCRAAHRQWHSSVPAFQVFVIDDQSSRLLRALWKSALDATSPQFRPPALCTPMQVACSGGLQCSRGLGDPGPRPANSGSCHSRFCTVVTVLRISLSNGRC